MASLFKTGGTWRIDFAIGTNGQRRSLRLGRLDKRTAESTWLRIQKLIAAKSVNGTPDPEMLAWIAGVDDTLHGRLAAVGLVEPRVAAAILTLGAFIDNFIAAKQDVKPHTRLNFEQLKRWLVKYFDKQRDVGAIAAADATAFRNFMIEQGLAEATYRRHLGRCRELFRWGIKRSLYQGSNPFADLSVTVRADKERQRFITRETADKLIDTAPDAEWRLLIALSRYGGIRVPSEALALTWGDVDFEHSRIRIPSPKTAHIPGKDCRFIPLFPELRRPLLDVFEQAQSGESCVITRYHGGSACNLRTHMTRIVRRAGLQMWPKPFHNMRASRQTELAESYPLHVVCEWIGNSKAVATEHYLQVTDAHFARAIQGAEHAQQNPQHEVQQKAQQHVQAPRRMDVNNDQKSLENSVFMHDEAQVDTALPISLNTPNRIRTGVCRLRICRPRPLDDGGVCKKCRGSDATSQTRTVRARSIGPPVRRDMPVPVYISRPVDVVLNSPHNADSGRGTRAAEKTERIKPWQITHWTHGSIGLPGKEHRSCLPAGRMRLASADLSGLFPCFWWAY